MLRYTFTNDLRSRDLMDKIYEVSNYVDQENVPSAAEDKSANNYSNTLIFYFNLYKDNENVKQVLQGNADMVVLNFIKKFQFPNPRTVSSFNFSVEDEVRLKPYQEILRLLYLGSFNDLDYYLTVDEILNFIFKNPNVAIEEEIDYHLLLSDIEVYRNTNELPEYIVQDDDQWEWKQSSRQIKELLNILNRTELIRFDGSNVFLSNNDLDDYYKASLFDILTSDEFLEVEELSFEEFKESYIEYMEMEHTPIVDFEFEFETGLDSNLERNKIVFGAPGTGKSYLINKEMKALIGNDGVFERVTFHPDYSYSHFVGTYKPVTNQNQNREDVISYEYVPGPFMRILTKALKNGMSDNVSPHLLIIEEINRANAAAVFGEIFQLLDRNKKHVSDYEIEPTEDMKKYLSKELGVGINDIPPLKLPDNLFIWSTMNSADQGVFPLDTAFKRRWEFHYIDTDNEEHLLSGKYVILGEGTHARRVEWNRLRKEINDILSTSLKVNEDKLIGTFFISKHIVVPESGDEINSDKFKRIFKNKVIMYLFEDAARHKGSTLFEGCENTTRYSNICREFDKRGVEIFGRSLSEKFPKISSDDQNQIIVEDSLEESE